MCKKFSVFYLSMHIETRTSFIINWLAGCSDPPMQGQGCHRLLCMLVAVAVMAGRC